MPEKTDLVVHGGAEERQSVAEDHHCGAEDHEGRSDGSEGPHCGSGRTGARNTERLGLAMSEQAESSEMPPWPFSGVMSAARQLESLIVASLVETQEFRTVSLSKMKQAVSSILASLPSVVL